MNHFFVQALLEICNIQTLAVILSGVVFGIIAGGIPGFTVTMAIVLAFPFTFAMDTITGVALMIGIFVGGYSGGLVSGIMLGIPGTPSSVTTVYDGYPMAQKGQPGRALGIGIGASFVGTAISVLVLALFGPLVARFSLQFGPWEIASVVLFALTMVGSLAQGNMLKGLFAAAVGLLITCFGASINGAARFTFGFSAMNKGIDSLPVLIGVFAFSQLMKNVEEIRQSEEKQKILRAARTKVSLPLREVLSDLWKQKWNLLRSSLIGCLVGALPAVGGETSNFISYDQAKKFSKHPDRFGTGIPDGIVASEASNNGVIGGAFIPTLTLGIPGNLPMAILLGILVMQGLTPGPLLFSNQPVLIGSIYASMLFGAVFMVLVMLFFIRYFAQISQVPQSIIIPVVLMLCSVGCFALNNSMTDVWVLLVFGVIGYLFSKCKIPLSPLILGVVLGGELETNMIRAYELNPSFLVYLQRPISAVVLALTVLSITFSVYQNRKTARNGKKDVQEEL